nr:DUF3786 domain-containing protein [Desulfobacterales bacterium]
MRENLEEREVYNQIFELDTALWEELERLSPDDVCCRALVSFDKSNGFVVPFLNKECLCDIHQRKILLSEGGENPVPFQVALIVLTYLVRAREIPLTNQMVTEREVKGGSFFFRGPHALFTDPVLERFHDRPQPFLDAGIALGGVPRDFGDASFEIRALPRVPVGYILYQGDEEFEPRIVVTFDSSIEHHLPLDVIWALVNVISVELIKVDK